MSMFGTDWDAATAHDGQGLSHLPPAGPVLPQRYSHDAMTLHIDEADALTGRLRHRALRAATYDPRLARIYGKAEARWLRRQWRRQQPHMAKAGQP